MTKLTEVPASSVTIEVTPEPEAATETAEVLAEAETEQVEAVTDTAVAVAQIEAERDITVAAIHAETEQAQIEARTETEIAHLEAQTERTGEVWDELASLREQMQSMQETLLILQPLSAAQPVEVVATETVEPEALEPEETTVTTSLTHPFTPEETSETPTEVIRESEAASLPEIIAAKPVRRIRLI